MPLSPTESATNHWQVETMSMYITPQDELHVEYQGIALTCPHCQTLTHLTAIAVPKFEDLSRRKPKHIGIVFRCDACAEPVFLQVRGQGLHGPAGGAGLELHRRSNVRARIFR